MEPGLLIIAGVFAGFAMIARRLSSTVLTAPMVFIAFGYLFSKTNLLPHAKAEEALHLVAEIALILLLFLDAAQINLSALRVRHVWPVRMLAIGLPISIGLGTLVAWPFLPGWPIVAVALVASILAPTDAALGQAVVSNPVVPDRARRALTVESGLNDGLALLAILLFTSLTAGVVEQDGTDWLVFGAKQLVYGPAAGAICGFAGGMVLLKAKKHHLTSETFEGIGAIALAGAAYLAATVIGGNGFISAFVAGLCFGSVVKGKCKFVYEFTESEGQLLTWGAFLLLGLALMPDAINNLSLSMLAIILTSLFVVRPAAIWLSLAQTDASGVTKLFFGWFGPRGLATMLFALLVVPQIGEEFSEPVLALAVNAVWISALLHGLSALPGAKWYSAKIKLLGRCAETEPIDQSAKPLSVNKSQL